MSDLTSLSRWILQGEQQYHRASGDFTILLSHIAMATKVVSRNVAHAGLVDVLGKTGQKNTGGDDVAKLDMIANELLVSMLDDMPMVAALASEEEEHFRPTRSGRLNGRYIVSFDPLDGSSNIDANVSIGTIFAIHRRAEVGREACEADFLASGRALVAAGYAIYGSSTMFVYSTGGGVDGFTLDPGVGEYILSHPQIRVPDRARCFSINASNRRHWDPGTLAFHDHILDGHTDRYRETTSRYIGSLVADFHRNLLYGGVFCYPGDHRAPEGKLRILYEAQPLAMLAEQAGGAASDGRRPILDLLPDGLHARTPLIIGNIEEVALYEACLAAWRVPSA